MNRQAVRMFAVAWIALIAAVTPAVAQISLVTTGAVWSYLDDGTDQGTAWRATAFDDSTWKSGFAPLGYGDPWIITTNEFGPDAANKHITTYYRALFNVPNAAAITNLLLRLQRDDGPVVYLNGVEIFRNNLPAGPILYNTLALGAIGGDDETALLPSNPSPSLLVNGQNVLAIEMHQNTTNSSDLTFDLALQANFNPVAPAVALTSPANGATLATANVTLVAAASDADGAITKVEFFQAGAKVAEDTTAPYSFTVVGLTAGTYTFSARATDSTGLATDSETIAVNVTAPPPTLVSAGATWKYLVTSAAAEPNWTNLNYPDATWPSGPAKLGYGDGDETTLIGFGPDTNNKYPTTYFRHKFNVANPALYSGLLMTLTYDDGAIVYLNGAEIYRLNLPAAPAVIAYNTLALGAADYTPDVSPLAASALLPGENILAVEMHQGSATSSDLAMALQIQGVLPPTVIITSPADGATLTVPVNFTINAEATDSDGTITRVDFFDGQLPLGSDLTAPYTLQVTALAEGTHVLTAVATDNSGSATTSAAVTITVSDPNAPALAAASATSNKVTVTFSKWVTGPTATTSGNYTITGGPGGAITVLAAEFGDSSNKVVLTTTTLANGASYTLTVNNVRDAQGQAIAPGSQIPFTVLGYAPVDVGGPVVAGSSVVVAGGFDVTGAGTDIGGTADQFHYNYETDLRTGDFDVKVRVSGFLGNNAFAKAGLMARETLAGGARYAASFATPGIAGCFFQSRAALGGATTSGGYAPVTYPNTWLRLKRAGNLFTGYASVDGNTWATLDSATIALPPSVYLGLAVSSRNAAQSATAQFRDIGTVVGGSVGSLVLSKEPPGPSSRKTGLVITEIMYHPRAIPGVANSLEFVEIFNSQSYFENIGNYRLSGAIDYTFPPGTVLPAGGYVVVGRDPAFLQSHYGISGVLGPWVGADTNGLPGSGGRVRLRNPGGAVLLEVNYDTDGPWPVSADGAGHSLVLARPSYGEGDPRAWSASDTIDGSPGRADPFSSDRLSPVVINEFLAHTDPPLEDFIELYNHSNQPIDLSGAYLTDESDTNKFRIPNGTTIPARGFYSVIVNTNATGFALSSGGERLYLVNSNRNRVIDALDFGPTENGVSTGRSPDGAPAVGGTSLYRMAARTPGAANSAPRNDGIVINEIMFSPISGDDDDEYVEIYNRGNAPVNLTDWSFVDGIDYTFPPNTIIASNGFLVVARNAARLLANYPNLNTANTVGNFDGSLGNGGERLALAMPEYNVSTNNGIRVTNTSYIVVNEVTYGDGGKWGNWADGGGSSLELKDPRSDNRHAANWADSDETDKGQWTTIEVTGNIGEVLSTANDNLQIFLLGIGECLVDEVEVRVSGGPNLIGGNYSFESGLTGWTPQGSHDHSVIENVGFISSRSLRLRAASRGDNGGNRVRSPAFAAFATSATNVTLRARAKWLRGWPELLLRLHGGGLEVGGRLAIQPNLGTPGALNSRAVPNAGPAIYDVIHTPILPAASEAVVVTARASDPNTPFALTLKYRIEPATTFTDVAMVDTGAPGDRIAGDGIYSATLPGWGSGTTVAFYIQGTDNAGGVNTFPQDLFPVAPATRVYPLDAVSRECVIRWGERQMPGSFGTYRLWLTAGNTARWTTRLPKLNNAPLDGTFVYNNYRVVYNMKPQFAGSPWHRGQMTTGPDGGNKVDYDIEFPEDDRFLGATDFVWNNPGNPGGTSTTDTSAQSEQTTYQIFREIGVQSNYRRYVHVFVNGSHRSTTSNRPGNFIFEDSQQPNGDIIAQWFPDDTDGSLYKIEDWFEFPDNGDDFTANNDADLIRRTTVLDGFPAFHTGAYRFMWRLRSRGVGESANDYSDFYDMLSVVSPTANQTAPIDLSAISDIVDYEQWMRIFACQHTVGNWDAYGYNRGKNAYTYKPANGKFQQWTWDIDFTMGIGGDGPTTGLFGTTDPRITAMWNVPAIRRAYWRAYEDIVNGPLNNAFMDPILDAKAAALAANNVNYDPAQVTVIKNYILARRNYLVSQLANFVNAPFAVSGSDTLTVNTNVLTLSGTAPVGVKDIYINGVLHPVTWTSETGWTLRVAVAPGANSLVIQAYDGKGKPIAGASRTVSVQNNAPAVGSPAGSVVINEIDFNPLFPEAEFVELFNTSATDTFDLAGLEFNGLDYVFPPASFIAPRRFLVLTKSRPAFAAAYGSAISVHGQFEGNLQADGETITLLKRGATPAQDLVIDKVRYEPGRPWPVNSNGVETASSIQLIDAAQDNSRPLNWNTFYVPPVLAPGTNFPGATNGGWRFASYTGRIQGTPSSPGTNFIIFLNSPGGELFVDDISLVLGSTPEAGTNWLLNGDFESPMAPAWTAFGNHTNSTISSARSRSGASSLRVLATGGGTTGHFVRQFIPPPETNNLEFTLSYWFFATTNATVANLRTQPGNAMNNVTNVQIQVLPPFAQGPRVVTPGVATVSPGSNNTATASLAPIPPLWLNELQAHNTAGILDNAGEREPWIELFNAGTQPVALAGLYLADNYDTNLTRWAFPAGASIGPGEFKVIFADGEPGESSATDLHTSFRLSAGAGQVALTRVVNGKAEILDYLTYSGVGAGQSYGDFPDGQPFARFVMREGTPRGTNVARLVDVYINEWLAANTNTIADPADGQFEDWFELYNAGTNAVDLGGFWLTDSPGSPNQYFQVPANGQYVIPAGGFLLVWADNEPSQNSPGRPDLHVDFALGRNGDSLALYAPDKQGLVDRVSFGVQTDDIAEGRYPDGANNTNTLAITTPRGPNRLAGGNTAPTIFSIGTRVATLGQALSFTVNAFDAQFSQTLTFTILSGAPAGATINASSGLFSWTSAFSMVPTTNVVTVQVTDNGTPPLSDSETFTLLGLPPPPSIGINGNQISLGFGTIPGKTYRVEYKDDLGAAVWSQLTIEDYPSGAATSLTVNDQLNQAQRFYRIVQLD